jgi:uroporphyrin-3 C-methyltransferase
MDDAENKRRDAAAGGDSAPGEEPKDPSGTQTPGAGGRGRAAFLAAVAAVIAVALVALVWYDTRERIGSTQEELARRLREVETEAREARSAARQSREALAEVQARIERIDTRLAESQSQQLALEALYQDLSRNRDEWQLAEVEQVLAIASQQLQLSGNVRAALLALELAEARIARSDRPQFLPIRRALARDIERLKALPTLDLAGLSLKLDRLVAAVDTLPLAFDERAGRPAAAARAEAAAERGFWARLGGEIWGELRQLVVVRRMDAPEPPLLPPTQAYFLRQNLRLRLLNARLSVLMRDESGYREDLRAAQAWIRRYFDNRAKATGEVLAQIRQLSSASLSFEVPAISESLEAVRGYKSRRERGS